jgi:hypothetical protein
MFETLDIMISLGVVFLILSMVLKYLMSMIKRLLKVKASVVAVEMKTFVGENTSKYLIPYLEKKAMHLNFLDATRNRMGLKKGEKGLRQLNKDQLKEVVVAVKDFLESAPLEEIQEELGLKTSVDIIDDLKKDFEDLKNKIEKTYDNTVERISEVYESKLRYFTLIIGLLLVVCINADFFDIYSSISKNYIEREKLIAQAEIISAKVSQIDTKLANKGEEVVVKKEIQEAKHDIAALTKTFKEAGLLLGWTKNKFSNAVENIGTFLNKLIGLFISGLLISFGAPFWHDFLSAFVGIKKTLRGRGERKGSAPS